MKEQRDRQQYIEDCKEFIDLIGRKQIRNDCEITLQNLNYWLGHGIPCPWFKFLCEKYKEEAGRVFERKFKL